MKPRITWRIVVMLAALFGCGARAHAEQRGQAPTSEPYRPLPSVRSAPSRLPSPLPGQIGPPLVSPTAPAPARLSDPAPSDWGSLDAPQIGPIQVPAVNYLLAGPPTTAVANDVASTYMRDVVDPNRLLRDDARFNMPINLYRPDGLAPAGVFYDHTLKGGGQMLFSYRYLVTHFQGNRDGTQPVGIDNVLAQFPIAPRRMTQERHVLLVEWAPSDNVTLTANLPFQQTSISQIGRDGGFIESSTMNPADIPVSALFVLRRWQRQQLHMNFGINVPVGMIDQLHNPPTFTSPNFSYPLRTSSGTYDLLPGVTYRGQNDRWTWGAQTTGVIRLGQNRFSYRLGNQMDLTAWLSRRVSDRLSLSARIDDLMQENVHHADPRIDPDLVPTNNPGLQAFKRTSLLFGLNYYFPDGKCPGQRFSFEAGFPVYQWVSGPQLGNNWSGSAAWNMIW